jgi:hypothetical protein
LFPRRPAVATNRGPTITKRQKERRREERKQRKAERLAQRRADREKDLPETDDDDLAGIVPGPQPSPWDD